MAVINGDRTLGEVKKSHKTKGSFNKAMRMDARKRYEESDRAFACKICGENRQIDICHMKSIEEFSISAKISKINGPKNIVVLCPLHHRIFDQNKKFVERIVDSDHFSLGIHLIIDFPIKTPYSNAHEIREKLKESIMKHIEKKLTDIKSNRTIWIDE